MENNVVKKLKKAAFIYEDPTREFTIYTDEGPGVHNRVTMTRAEAQLFARFVFRVLVRYFYPKKYSK